MTLQVEGKFCITHRFYAYLDNIFSGNATGGEEVLLVFPVGRKCSMT
jgi:hypothetical protein